MEFKTQLYILHFAIIVLKMACYNAFLGLFHFVQ